MSVSPLRWLISPPCCLFSSHNCVWHSTSTAASSSCIHKYIWSGQCHSIHWNRTTSEEVVWCPHLIPKWWLPRERKEVEKIIPSIIIAKNEKSKKKKQAVSKSKLISRTDPSCQPEGLGEREKERANVEHARRRSPPRDFGSKQKAREWNQMEVEVANLDLILYRCHTLMNRTLIRGITSTCNPLTTLRSPPQTNFFRNPRINSTRLFSVSRATMSVQDLTSYDEFKKLVSGGRKSKHTCIGGKSLIMSNRLAPF